MNRSEQARLEKIIGKSYLIGDQVRTHGESGICTVRATECAGRGDQFLSTLTLQCPDGGFIRRRNTEVRPAKEKR